MLVVAIALSLPFAGLTMLDNVRPMSEQMSVDPEISVFLKIDTPREQAVALASSMRKIVGEQKAKIVFIPREQALDTLKNKNGLADVLSTLGDNPLPDSYVLKLDAFSSATKHRMLMQSRNSCAICPAWNRRKSIRPGSNAWRLCWACCAWSAVAGHHLGVAVIAVVFNTIRLQVMQQRDEISISN